ncbi:MAG: 3-phosphoshikimate 1-carboxyvinyltransferase [Opitutales bacterium]
MTVPAYPDPYRIRPFSEPVAGEVVLPGSKSLTNRALILAALSERDVTLMDSLDSRDTQLMIDALRTLGFIIETETSGEAIRVEGLAGDIPRREAVLDVGNSGTTARFLTALLCLHPGGTYRVDGDAAMRERPMAGLTDVLTAWAGARFTFHGREGHIPFTLETRGLPGGVGQLDASASSQILSAVLMVAPYADADVTLHIRGEKLRQPYVDMTLGLMRQFGQRCDVDRNTLTYRVDTGDPYPEAPASYVVEPDASAASYFLALPLAVPATLTLRHLGTVCLQGDIAFAGVVAEAGVSLNRQPGSWEASSPRPGGRGVDRDFFDISDTFMTLAAVSPLLTGSTTLSGIAHTRNQETDRVAAMAAELRKLGQRVEESNDRLIVHPDPQALREIALDRITEIDTYEDHRIAMSFGILGCADIRGDGKPWLAIRDPACCGKTFPGFFRVLESLQPNSPSRP